MKNLYKQLDLSSDASHDEIVKALDKEIRSYVKEDAKFVLLSRDRKRVFDRCNESLEQIGKIRVNLGLDHAPNWVSHKFTSYQHGPTRKGSIIDEILDDSKTNKPTNKRDYKTPPENDENLFLYLFWAIVIGLFTVPFLNSGANEEDYIIRSENEPETEEYQYPEWLAERHGYNEENNGRSTTNDLSNTNDQAFDKEPAPLPVNGYTYNYTSKEPLAPLEISTPSYSGHYFVVFNDFPKNEKSFIVFIRAGQSVNVLVPLGSYRMKYAVGENWYGVENLFGPGDMTRRFKTEHIFDFTDEGNEYVGYTIELTSQEGGDMYTSEVSASEWSFNY